MTQTDTSFDTHGDSCPEYVGLVVRAADDGLDEVDRTKLDAHLIGCRTCQDALDAQRSVHHLVADAYVVEPPLGFSTRVLAHVDVTTRWFDRLDFRRWTLRVGPVAAGLLLAAGLAVLTEQPSAASTDQPTVPWTDVMNENDLVTMVWEASTVDASNDEVAP